MKKRIFSLNLKQIALITGPLAIVALFICSSFMHITHGIITGSIFQITSDLNQKVEHEIRMAFEPPTFALNTIVASSKENQNQSVIQNLLSATADQYPQCSAFYYGSSRREASGGFFATSQDVPYSDGIDHTERGWFTGAVARNGELFVTMQNPASSNEQAYITFSRAVIDQRGNTVGVAGCDILLSRLAQIVSDAKLSQHASVSIINKDGLYLTNPNQSYIMKRSYFEDSRLPEKLRNAENYLGEKRLPFIQDNMFFAVRKLADTPWYVVIEGPLSDFTKKITHWMLIILLVVVLLIVSCVIFNSILIGTMRKKEAAAGEQLMAETQNLVVAAKENAATSQDQSAAVKEIVATMEDNTALSESISTKITDVSTVATKTNDDVVDGVGYLEANVRQLHEISDANQTTIDGIKALGGKIENIWDIVTLINSVADQAKIIAFNAELEASSAGEAGKNFHIVATEIRRLADGIIGGTKEIKEKINEIQQSSDNLILASESGTEKIAQGYERAKILSARFESIKNASEVTAASAKDISTIIQQQAVASEQILITLRQISAGVENFTAATENISTAAQNLKTIAGDLNAQNVPESEG